MKKAKFLERLGGCHIVAERSGVKDFHKRVEKLKTAGGVELSKATKWLKAVERACIEEAEVYKDLTPTAWLNLTMLNPGSADLRGLRAKRLAVRKAWKA